MWFPRPAPVPGFEEVNASVMGAHLLTTPGMVQTEMDAVDAALMTLVKDVAASNAPQTFRDALGEFARAWIAFKERNAGWWTKGFFGVYEQVQEYKERLNQWRDKFVALGGKPTAPELKLKKPVFTWKLAAVAGGIAALVWFVTKD